MSDIIHKVIKQASYNRYAVLGVLAAASVIALPACERYNGRVANPETGIDQNTAQLSAAYNQSLAAIENRWAQGQQMMTTAKRDAETLGMIYDTAFDQAALELEQLSEVGGLVTTTLATNPATASIAPFITTALGIALGGVVLDNRRKDRMIP